MSFFSFPMTRADISLYTLNAPATLCLREFSALLFTEGRAASGGRIFPASSLILLPPGLNLSVAPEPSCNVMLFRFSNFALLTALENDSVFSAPHNSVSLPALSRCITVLSDMQDNRRKDSRSLFSAFVDILNRIFPAERPEYPALAGRGAEILTYTDSHLLESAGLNETAAALNLTPQYLASFFKKTTGMTFSEYTGRQKARLLLPFVRYTGLSRERIAAFAGFSGPEALDKAFLSMEGASFDTIRSSAALPESDLLFPEEAEIPGTEEYLPDRHSAPEQFSRKDTETILDSAAPHVTNPEDSWKSILNIGEVYNMTDSAFAAQLLTLQHTIRFTHARILNLLDSTVIHEVNGSIFFGFDRVFRTLDALIAEGLTPFITIGCGLKEPRPDSRETWIPDAGEAPRSYYEKILRILQYFIRSCCNRYSAPKVSEWLIEIRFDFEADDPSRQTIRQFVQTYTKIEEIIHSFVPELRVGGPGFMSDASFSELDAFINAVKAGRTRLDFLTLSSSGKNIITSTEETLDIMHAAFPELPVFITEFSPFHELRNPVYDTTGHACGILRFFTAFSSKVKGIGYGAFSDIAAAGAGVPALLFGGQGLLNTRGLPKPSCHCLYFMNQMSPLELLRRPGLTVTLKTRFNYEVLVYDTVISSRNDLLSDARHTLTFRNMYPGIYLVRRSCINSDHGDLKSVLNRLPGLTDLSFEEKNYLQRLTEPDYSIFELTVREDGLLRLDITIAPNEILLISVDFNRKELPDDLQW